MLQHGTYPPPKKQNKNKIKTTYSNNVIQKNPKSKQCDATAMVKYVKK